MLKFIIDSDYNTSDAVVIGVPYEHTASFGVGTKLAPKAIFDILDTQIELFDRYSETEPAYDFKFGSKILTEVSDMEPEIMVSYIKKFLSNEKRFTLLIGGEHSVTIPALQALRAKHINDDITIVQIDAHFDLRKDDSDYNELKPSIYAHSTVMRHAYSMGFRILPVGIRTIAKEEFDFVKKNNIQYFEWGRYNIKEPAIQDIIDSIQSDKIYLTIDVDGFDPSVMPGTGTPVPGGLGWTFSEGLIRELIKQKNLLGADIVEVLPTNITGQTEYNAAQLAYLILSTQNSK